MKPFLLITTSLWPLDWWWRHHAIAQWLAEHQP